MRPTELTFSSAKSRSYIGPTCSRSKSATVNKTWAGSPPTDCPGHRLFDDGSGHRTFHVEAGRDALLRERFSPTSEPGSAGDSNRSLARRNSAQALIKSFSACLRSFKARALVAYNSLANSWARVEYSSSRFLHKLSRIGGRNIGTVDHEQVAPASTRSPTLPAFYHPAL